MEKSTAHYKLAHVRALIAERRVVFTASAARGHQAMSMSRAEALTVVDKLVSADFYKSMTTYRDHRVWQDVYHPRTPFGSLYVKLTVQGDLLVVSFKIR